MASLTVPPHEFAVDPLALGSSKSSAPYESLCTLQVKCVDVAFFPSSSSTAVASRRFWPCRSPQFDRRRRFFSISARTLRQRSGRWRRSCNPAGHQHRRSVARPIDFARSLPQTTSWAWLDTAAPCFGCWSRRRDRRLSSSANRQ